VPDPGPIVIRRPRPDDAAAMVATMAAEMCIVAERGFELEGTLRAYALRGGVFVDSHCMARLHPTPPQPPTV
jgi:hypothetical protein